MKMKKIGAILFASAWVAIAATAGEMQTWTYASGKTVQAEFLRLSGNTVFLRPADGNSIMVPLSRLDNASQEAAREAAKNAATPAVRASVGQAASGGAASNGAARTGLTTAKSKDAIPSDEEIGKWKTEFQPQGKEERYSFEAMFGLPALDVRARKKYAKGPKVPYRVTVELRERRMVDGKMLSKRMDGSANIIILDETGQIVDRAKEALGKLCPS
jgi:hypothetical protein